MLAKTANMTTDNEYLGKLFRHSSNTLKKVSTAGSEQLVGRMKLPVNKRKRVIESIKQTTAKTKNRDKRMDIWKAQMYHTEVTYVEPKPNSSTHMGFKSKDKEETIELLDLEENR